MFIVSISIANHDASICIMKNENVLLFIQEERISKVKHDSSLPLKMLNCVSNYTNNIDYLCLSNITNVKEKNYILNFFELNNIKINNVIEDSNHHLFHASSGFYGSGFEESICLVIDGWGSDLQIFNDKNSVETTSIYHAEYPNKFETIYKNVFVPISWLDPTDLEEIEKNIDYDIDLNTHLDIGVMYGTVTHHIGYSRTDQGKTMGLSAYGKEDNNIPNMLCEDSIFSNMNLFKVNRTLNTKVFNYLKSMNFETKSNLCYKLQKSLEKVFLARIDYITKKTDCKNIVFSGGCALNVVGNSLIKEKFPQVNFYVDPIANDACQSFGCAKYYYYKITNSKKVSKLNNIYLGENHKNISPKLIKKIVNNYNNYFNYN